MNKVLIIGSNRGIGLALTKEYSKNYDVTALCRSTSKELSSIENINIVEDIDVTDEKKLHLASKKLSGTKFDIILHVSGIWADDEILSESPNWSEMTKAFEVNSIAPLKTIIAFKQLMTKGTKVGLLSSRMGSIEDNDSGGRYAYRMSKAALNAAGKSLSIDLKSNEVSVAVLHPGFVQTDMTNGNGNITPKESAEGLIKVMNEVNLSNSGSFWHTNGERLPW